MIFKDVWVLLCIPVAIILGYIAKKRRASASIRFSSGQLLSSARPTWRIIVANNLIYLRVAAIVLFILALARPRIPLEETKIQTEGIDIVLAIDCSSSMLAEDFTIGGKRYNRLAVVKDVVKDFIKGRKSDRIAMVAFAARAYTV